MNSNKIPHFFEFNSSQNFSKYVSLLLISRNVLNLNLFILDTFSDEVISLVYMLASTMEYWVLCKCNCQLVINVDHLIYSRMPLVAALATCPTTGCEVSKLITAKTRHLWYVYISIWSAMYTSSSASVSIISLVIFHILFWLWLWCFAVRIHQFGMVILTIFFFSHTRSSYAFSRHIISSKVVVLRPFFKWGDYMTWTWQIVYLNGEILFTSFIQCGVHILI